MNAVRDVFLCLSDPLRVRCLALMGARGDLCLCQLAAATGESRTDLMAQLAVLVGAGLVEAHHCGPWMLYRLTRSTPAWVCQSVAAAVLYGKESPDFFADIERLRIFGPRPDPRAYQQPFCLARVRA